MVHTLRHVLNHLRRLSSAEAAHELADGELLDRFLAQREEAAFAILVQRHGPMVRECDYTPSRALWKKRNFWKPA